jgi:hypothetical protein
MSLVQWIAEWWDKKRLIEELAEQLTTASLPEVRRTFSYQVAHMTGHELRGYVRTRASPIVRRLAEQAGQRYRISTPARQYLQSRIVDSITQRVQREYALSARTHAVRRAA